MPIPTEAQPEGTCPSSSVEPARFWEDSLERLNDELARRTDQRKRAECMAAMPPARSARRVILISSLRRRLPRS